MPRRSFIQALLVAVGLLIALNMAVGWLGRNAVPRVIVRKIHSTTNWTHVVLGNSVPQAGFSPERFEAAASGLGAVVKPLNAGLGWSTAAEHGVLWNEVEKSGNHPAVVVYGFFDLKLHEYTNSVWWGLEGNMAMAYYVDPALAARYHAPGSAIGAAFMRTVAHLPLFTERSTVWSKVEKLRIWLARKGMKPQQGNPEESSAPVTDAFRAFESASANDFARACAEVVLDNKPFHPAIEDLIAGAKRTGSRLVFVEMPMTPEHRRLFYTQPGWLEYKRHLAAKLAAMGAELIEAGDWVPDGSHFGDSLHMNQLGAEMFSDRLARSLVAKNPAARSPK